MADPDALLVLTPFERGIKQAHAYRAYLVHRFAAEEQYAAAMARVLDAHPLSPPDADQASISTKRSK